MKPCTGIPLVSERLTLREFVPDDESAVHAYASDPVVTRFLGDHASAQVLQKAGMHLEAHVQVLGRGSWRDSLLFAAGRK